MRIKEVSRTSNISWSPGNVHPMYIAAGTSAKQLDASFRLQNYLKDYLNFDIYQNCTLTLIVFVVEPHDS